MQDENWTKGNASTDQLVGSETVQIRIKKYITSDN